MGNKLLKAVFKGMGSKRSVSTDNTKKENVIETPSSSSSSKRSSGNSTLNHMAKITKGDAAAALSHEKKALDSLDPNVYGKAMRYPVAKSPKSLMELTQGPSAILLAGEEQVPFTVPMNLLFNHSKYAERIFFGGFTESGINAIKMTEEDPETVGLFLLYIQQGELRVSEYCSKAPIATRPTQESHENYVKAFFLLCNLYILIDKLVCQYWEQMSAEIRAELQDVLLRAEGYYQDRSIITPETILRVYHNTSEDSKLRTLITEHFCMALARINDHSSILEGYAQCMAEFPKEFGLEIIKRLILGYRWEEY